MLTYLLLVLGFVFVVKGAQLLIDGSSYLARRIGLSPFIVGATVIALGTSMPELSINLVATYRGIEDIGLATVLGSTIATILLTGGIAAIIRPYPIKLNIAHHQLPLAGGLVVVLFLLANNFFLTAERVIDRFDALVLFTLFAVGIYYLIGNKFKNNQTDFENNPRLSTTIAVADIIIGVAGLIIGGDWVVEGATKLAELWHISTPFIGLTMVAVGANLPEIVTAIIGSLRRNTELVIGNIVGSIIFNLGAVVGLIGLINPISFNPQFNSSIIVVIGAIALLCFMTIAGHKKRSIERVEGLAMICAYLIYLAVIAVEG